MGGEISADNFVRFDNDLVRITVKNGKTEYSKENSRNVSLRLRLKVLNRYNFKCIFLWKKSRYKFRYKIAHRSYRPVIQRWKEHS
jgi:hypothetical protein